MLYAVPQEIGRSLKEILTMPKGNLIIREHAEYLRINKGESVLEFVFYSFNEAGASLWHDGNYSSTITIYPEDIGGGGNSLPAYRKPQCIFSYDLREQITQAISDIFLASIPEENRAKFAWWLQMEATKLYISSIPDKAWAVSLTDEQKTQVILSVTKHLINEHGIENLLKQLENQ
jgi:hypothetical protein